MRRRRLYEVGCLSRVGSRTAPFGVAMGLPNQEGDHVSTLSLLQVGIVRFLFGIYFVPIIITDRRPVAAPTTTLVTASATLL